MREYSSELLAGHLQVGDLIKEYDEFDELICINFVLAKNWEEWTVKSFYPYDKKISYDSEFSPNANILCVTTRSYEIQRPKKSA